MHLQTGHMTNNGQGLLIVTDQTLCYLSVDKTQYYTKIRTFTSWIGCRLSENCRVAMIIRYNEEDRSSLVFWKIPERPRTEDSRIDDYKPVFHNGYIDHQFMDITPDGQKAVTFGVKMHVWDTNTGRVTHQIHYPGDQSAIQHLYYGSVSFAASAENGSSVAMAYISNKAIAIWTFDPWNPDSKVRCRKIFRTEEFVSAKNCQISECGTKYAIYEHCKNITNDDTFTRYSVWERKPFSDASVGNIQIPVHARYRARRGQVYRGYPEEDARV
mmetsp:Transcript_6833/g.16770  ORF Transcript_6833/g.16770 Transcript_6833/m.16770 type:complete len:271 (+) Transcript_6833:300-1112(+)